MLDREIDWNLYQTKHNSWGLADLVERDKDALSLVFKFHPELDCDWSEKSREFCLAWRAPVRKILLATLRQAEQHLGVPNYRLICHLPRKEFAQWVLQDYGPLRKLFFDESQMMQWAGYEKPKVKHEGNVAHVKFK